MGAAAMSVLVDYFPRLCSGNSEVPHQYSTRAKLVNSLSTARRPDSKNPGVAPGFYYFLTFSLGDPAYSSLDT